MCGIVGIFGPIAPEVNLGRSVELLIDRGPDSHAVVQPSNFLNLGAARLAMTDPLPRSNQPFEKNHNWIVFNGEIYNHNELRKWLRDSHGINFVTNSDTEVLIEILSIYGSEGIQYLNGMFAFAYYDSETQKLILGRDRLGKKPLYYSIKDENFYWASTIPALRQISSSHRINESAVLSYLAFGYTVDPATIYMDIQSVKPGHCFEIQKGILLKEIKSPMFDSTFKKDIDASSLYGQIKSSVFDRIEGHYGVAISLSGGLDSSIVAQLSSQSNRQVVAYSLRWSDSDKSRYNTDFEKAEVIAKNLGLSFIGVDFLNGDGDLEASLKDFVRFMGEPNSNPTGVSLIPLYRRISQDGFRLVLTGDGSDEIFGGYPRYESHLLGRAFRFVPDKQLITLTAKFSSLEKLYLRIANPCSPGLWANFHWNFKPEEIVELLRPIPSNTREEITQDLFALISSLDFKSAEYESRDPLAKIIERDSSIWLTNESNRKLDRISMAFSIEARSPFQDERVIKMANQLMRENHFKTNKKESLRKLFPELRDFGVRDDKAGFISPVGHWLRTNPSLVTTGLEAVVNSGLFNSNEIMRRRNDQFSGDFIKIRQLWSLVVLGYWLLYSWEI